MPDITVVLTGPKTTDVKIFEDGYRVGGLQIVEFEIDAKSMVPSISMSFPFIRLWKEEIPKGDGYMTICYKDAVSDCSKFMIDRMVTLRYGSVFLGGVSKIRFTADVQEDRHTLTLEYPNKEWFEVAVEEQFGNGLPDWVNIVIQE